MAQGGGIILVGIAAGDLIQALLEQGAEGVAATSCTPVRDCGSESGGQPQRVIGLP